MRNIDTYAGALLAVICIGALILWALALCRSAARSRPSLPTIAYDQPVARISDDEFHEWVKGWKP